MVIKNNQITRNQDFVRIQVQSLNYSAQVWDSDQSKFIDVPFDINENKHFDNKGKLFSDYEIFIK